MINVVGLAALAGAQVNVGFGLAGQRAVMSHDDVLLRTLPCPVPSGERHRLRGVRRAIASSPPLAGPVTVQRRISQRGSIMVATHRIQVSMIHASKAITATADDRAYLLDIDGEIVATVPRTTSSEIHRYKGPTQHSVRDVTGRLVRTAANSCPSGNS